MTWLGSTFEWERCFVNPCLLLLIHISEIVFNSRSQLIAVKLEVWFSCEQEVHKMCSVYYLKARLNLLSKHLALLLRTAKMCVYAHTCTIKYLNFSIDVFLWNCRGLASGNHQVRAYCLFPYNINAQAPQRMYRIGMVLSPLNLKVHTCYKLQMPRSCMKNSSSDFCTVSHLSPRPPLSISYISSLNNSTVDLNP